MQSSTLRRATGLGILLALSLTGCGSGVNADHSAQKPSSETSTQVEVKLQTELPADWPTELTLPAEFKLLAVRKNEGDCMVQVETPTESRVALQLLLAGWVAAGATEETRGSEVDGKAVRALLPTQGSVTAALDEASSAPDRTVIMIWWHQKA